MLCEICVVDVCCDWCVDKVEGVGVRVRVRCTAPYLNHTNNKTTKHFEGVGWGGGCMFCLLFL